MPSNGTITFNGNEYLVRSDVADGIYKIEIGIRPIGKVRLNRSDSWKKKDGTFRREAVQRWYEYKDLLKYVIQTLNVNIADTNDLEIQAWFQMPKGWSAKKKARMTGMLHDVKPDADNIAKGVMDSLFEHDQQIGILHVEKHWGDKDSLYMTFRNWGS